MQSCNNYAFDPKNVNILLRTRVAIEVRHACNQANQTRDGVSSSQSAIYIRLFSLSHILL